MSAFARVFTQSASVLIRRPSISVPHRAVWWPLTAARLSQPLLSTASCFRFSVKMIYSGLVCHPGLTHSRPSMSVIQCQPRPWWHSPLPPQLSSVSLGPSQTGVRGSPRRQLSVDCRAVNISGTRATASSGMDDNDGSMTRISRGDQ